MIQEINRRQSTADHPNIRVLHVVNGQHYAGAARVQDLLALRLPEFGYDISFACLLPERFAEERESQDAPLFNFPMKHRMDFAPAREIAALARQNGYDILHSHTTRSAMIAAAAARAVGIPHVHHVHCQMNSEVGSRVKSFINTTIERLAGNRADRMIAVSGSIKRFLERNGFTQTEICTVPNGVPSAAKLRPRRDAGDPWTIGMVALLRERKGLETLLRAFQTLRAEFNVRLRIVGPFESEPYRQHSLQLADDLGVSDLVDWIPFTRDVNHEITQMDVLVLPSVLPEGMPMVLLEGMSAGVPIVGSNVDGICDVIRHEQNGLMAESNCAESLSQQLRRILSGDISWDDLRTTCLQDYEQMFSDRAMAAGVARVYDDVLGQISRKPVTTQEILK